MGLRRLAIIGLLLSVLAAVADGPAITHAMRFHHPMRLVSPQTPTSYDSYATPQEPEPLTSAPASFTRGRCRAELAAEQVPQRSRFQRLARSCQTRGPPGPRGIGH